VTATIEALERDVQRAFKEAFTIATGAANRPLQVIETSLWSALLALGRALIALYLARVASRPRATSYVHDGVKYEVDGVVSTEIGTRFGRVAFRRPVGRRVGWRRAARDRPVDRELGLPARPSPPSASGRRVNARCCAWSTRSAPRPARS
jgi:hypothetical protein